MRIKFIKKDSHTTIRRIAAKEADPMTAHPTHSDHDHPHGPSCGHVAVEHDGHVHHRHGDHYDEH
jgi:hypothetical protein